MTIRFRIEHLVLDGVLLEPGQDAVVKAAVEAELTRLLADGGVAARAGTGGTLASARGGHVRLGRASTPEALGREIAASVHEGVFR